MTAQVYDVAVETELELAKNLWQRLSNHVYLKREDSQPVFSFKLRGVYNKMAKLPAQLLKKGVICASAGNHAQGVALAANKLQCKAVIALMSFVRQFSGVDKTYFSELALPNIHAWLATISESDLFAQIVRKA